MTIKHYPEIDANPNFAELEQQVLDFWKADGTFKKSVENRPARAADGSSNAYVFYDGPPFANGLPHYGHLLTGYVKDAIARYHTMKGARVERRFGWDCHGLPAEMGAEKDLGISGRAAIMRYGIDKFNEHCRTSVMKYTQDWNYYVTRQGRWVDFENDYKTMDVNFMESCLWAFKELYAKGLIYESMRVMPYSWAAETPVSNFETRIDNATREREDKAAYVKFKLKEKPAGTPDHEECYLIAWTTTPWTLPSNLALAVNSEMEYLGAICQKGTYFFAKSAFLKLKPFLDGESPDLEFEVAPIDGSKLLNLTYEPLFPYFADTPNAFRVLDGSEFVTDGDGTGIVHMAPGFGEVDYDVCKKNGIEALVPVDEKGRFTAEIFDIPWRHPERSEGSPVTSGDASAAPQHDNLLKLHGLTVVTDTRIAEADITLSEEDKAQHISAKDVAKYGLANMRIVRWLKANGKLVKDEPYKHNYPHCWRTDTPLIYRAMSSWYVNVQKIKATMAANNETIHWIPDHVQHGQMGKGIESAPDWSISRNRFWGTPIPIWKSASGKIHVCGSIEEIEKLSGQKVADLHRPYIDNVVLKIDGEEYTRIEDVFDCWFESGSMPYAQVHYPFENKDWFEENFPADFITEYIAQTRGWFYTLQVLSAALFKDAQFLKSKGVEHSAPFKNVICHGVVIDEETGLKYSKRLKNYKDPKEVMDQFGADALRWMMLASPVMRGADLGVDPDGKFIRDVVRLNIKPLWSAYNFFTLYANADGVKARLLFNTTNETDRCTLRPFTTEDEAAYITLVGNPEAMKTIGGGVRTPEEAKKELAFLIEHQAKHEFSIWAVCDKTTGKLLGKAGFTYVALDSNQPPQASLHYLFGPESWGKGIAKEIAHYLVGLAFSRLKFEKIVAATLPDNIPSVKIIEANGFAQKNDITFKGKSCSYYELTRAEFDGAANLLDRYILAKARGAVVQVKTSLDAYDTPGATDAITSFFDVLNNWYIRRSRSRFWGESVTADKQSAYDTLFTLLTLMCKVAAPLLPFTAEAVYRGLHGAGESVHLADFPDVSGIDSAVQQIYEMDVVRDICNAASSVRNKAGVRNRQPFNSLKILGWLSTNTYYEEVIKDEINVKKVDFAGEENLLDYAKPRLQIFSQVVGKKFPKEMKEILAAAKKPKPEYTALDDGKIKIAGVILKQEDGDYTLALEPVAEYQNNSMSFSASGLVILDLTITPELEAEGRARDLVRMIQQARKDAGLNVGDRITLGIDAPEHFKAALATHAGYIAEQTLAVSLTEGSAGATQQMKQELDGDQFVIGISRAA